MVLIVSLALIALLAARRAALPPWKRLGLVVAMVGLGAAVVAITTLAHRPRAQCRARLGCTRIGSPAILGYSGG